MAMEICGEERGGWFTKAPRYTKKKNRRGIP